MARPTASLSLDLDNLWSYLKTHGEEEWKRHPTYLPTFVPIVLDWLARHDRKITFFVVGLDAELAENHACLRRITEAGHELGNHSYHHEPWMADYDEARVQEELLAAHRRLESVTGRAPVGFRGPGFAHSRAMLTVLARLGYGFDASILPSMLGPIARLYYLWGTRMSRAEKETRRGLFGRFSDGFLPLRPFLWDLSGARGPDRQEAGPAGELLEIPVTTIPLFRVPFHLSYILWLSRYSKALALLYLKFGLAMCRMLGVEPSYLLHPLDFLGREDAPHLAFFPGMDLPRSRKLEIADALMRELSAGFEVVPMSEHARRIRARGGLRRLPPPPDQ